MHQMPLEFLNFTVIDAHVVADPRGSAPDRWEVDGIALDERVLVVTGLLGLTRIPKRYRIGGVVNFVSDETPVTSLDQEDLAQFVGGPASRLLYSHLRSHLNTLAGIVGEAGQFSATPSLKPDLLRSSENRWSVRSVDDTSRGGLAF